MKAEEVKEYFKNEVYKIHPEYQIEIVAPVGSPNIYIIVHLESGYCYCFLLVPCESEEEYKKKKPTQDQLNQFMQNNFNNCVLKKVCLIYEYESGKFQHKTFEPEID
jgi:hypothetical protein